MAEVKVYSTPTCPYCKMVKQFLTENNIAFTDINVAASLPPRRWSLVPARWACRSLISTDN
jgi:arsenate reductase-like glutaredoxin family protein